MNTKLTILNQRTRITLNRYRINGSEPGMGDYIVLKGHDEDLNKVSLRLPTNHEGLLKIIDENSNHALSFAVDEKGVIQKVTMIV